MSVRILSQRFSGLTEIATTNFSSVYRAIDSVGKHPIALKVAAGAGGQPDAALKREFNFLSSCAHPNIIEAYDFGTDETDRPFYTMKWIAGATLFEAAPRSQLIASDVIPSLCSALGEIHGAGFIYGDLNPSNILVTRDNGGFQTTLIDFGLIARKGASYPGELRGTMDFMAPEIHRGDPLTAATDIYSFGVLLRQLLEDQERNREVDLSTLVHLNPLRDLIKQCLNYYPDSRPQDFQQIKELWWRGIARTTAKPEPTITPPRKSRRLFGRTEDMRKLRRRCADLLDRPGGIIVVNGAKGIGKTALIREHCQIAQMRGSATLRIICDDVAEKVDIILEAIDAWIAGSKDDGESVGKGFFIYLETSGLFDTVGRPVRRIIEKIQGHRIACIVECGQMAPAHSEDVHSIILEPLPRKQFEELLTVAFESNSLAPPIFDFLYRASGGVPGLLEAKRLEYVAYLRQGGRPADFSWRRPPQQLMDDFAELTGRFSATEQQVVRSVALVRSAFSADDMAHLSGTAAPIVERVLGSLVGRGYVTVSRPDGRPVYDIAAQWLDFAFRAYASQFSAHADVVGGIDDYRGEIRARLRCALAAPSSVAEVDQGITEYGDIRNLPEAVVAGRKIHYARHPWMLVSLRHKRAIYKSVISSYEKIGDIGRARAWVLRLARLHGPDDPDSRYPSFEMINETLQVLNRFCTPEQRESWISQILNTHADIDPAIHALLLSELGVVEYYAQRMDKALARFFEAEAIYAGLNGNHGSRARNLSRIGGLYMTRRQYDQALKYLKSAEAEARRDTDEEVSVAVKLNIGIVLQEQGLAAEAREFFLAGLNYAKRAHHFKLLSMISRNMTLCLADLSPAPEAVRSAEEARLMAHRVGDATYRAMGLSNVGWAYLRAGNVREAYMNIMSAIAVAKETGNLRVLALAYLNLARLFHLQGRSQDSIRNARKSYSAAKKQGAPEACAEAMRELAVYFLAMGRNNQAERFLQRAFRLCADQSNRRVHFYNHAVATEIDIRAGRLEEATRRLKDWEATQFENLQPGWVCTVNRLRGLLKLATDNYQPAAGHLRDAACQARAYERYDLLIPIYEDLVDCYARAANKRVGVPYVVELSRLYQKVGRMDHNNKLEAAIQSLMQQPGDMGAANMVFQLSESLARFSDKRQLLDYLLNLAVDYFGADRGALISKHPVSGHLFVEAQRDLATDLDRSDALELSKTVINKVSATNECLKIDNAVQDPATRKKKSIILNNIQSVLCVPVIVGTAVWGVVYLDNRSVPGAFAQIDIRILQALANFMALAIEQTDEMNRLRLGDSTTRPSPDRDLPFIAESRKMRSLLSYVDKIADSDASVVILGENGTGKDLLAGYIHQRSKRRNEPFITMNCAGLVETLADSELFGIEDNVASGVKFREGKFKLADRGTLFLNEIGDLPLSIQSKILQALQDKKIERVGGSPMAVDVRFIAATNKNLEEMVKTGKFRTDLFYRINSVIVTIPPLAERVEDIPALARSFLEYYCKKYGRSILELNAKNFEEFAMYPWQGNVRELKGLIERGVLLADGKSFPVGLTRSSSRKPARSKHGRRKLETLLEQTERECIIEALSGAGWNQSKAANWLGLRESTLRSKIQRLGIEKPRKL